MTIRTSHVLLLTIILAGLFLRSYQYQYYPLGFDSIQILSNAEAIRQGDFSLIGPQTGPAHFFTGPLVYYLTALLMPVVPLPYTGIALSVFLAGITGITLALLSYTILGEKKAIISTTLWAVSPFLIPLDRIPWNPNLTVLASSLSFFPLLALAKNTTASTPRKHTLLLTFLIASGSFLGYQAHFAGLLLPFLVVGCLLLLRNRTGWYYLAAIGGVALSLLPTVLFDIRHEYLNSRGILALFEQQSTISSSHVFLNITNTLRISIENIGKVLLLGTPIYLIMIVGYVSSAVALYESKKSLVAKKQTILSFMWLLGIAVVFALYKEDTPEYYYLVQIPPILYILSTVFARLFTSTKMLGIACALVFIYSYQLHFSKLPALNLELGNQQKIVKQVEALTQNQLVSEITYDMASYDALGLTYLLEKKQLSFSESGQSLHIIYPYQSGNLATNQFENAAIWLDPRTDTTSNYLSTPAYIIKTPASVQLLENKYKETDYSTTTYSFLIDATLTASDMLVIHERQPNAEQFKEITSPFEKVLVKEPTWIETSFKGKVVFAITYPPYFFVVVPNDSLITREFLEQLIIYK